MTIDFLGRTLVTARDEIEAHDGELQGTLTVLVGTEVGAVFVLDKPSNLIGRNEQAEITLVDDGISRRHASIVRNGPHYELEDHGSTNGTFIGSERISVRTRLRNGARVRCGDTLLRFALQDEVEQQATRKIYEMSVRDGLTGLYNRRHFDERVEAEFAFALRHKAALCVMMCDIDHFKKVNDQYGHRGGDCVLRAVADKLREGVRTEDLVARYGGEELAIVARAIDFTGARVFAERMRTLIERTKVEWEGQTIAVTLSIGVAHNHAGPTVKSADQLVAAADHALYSAKHAGRNRVQTAVSAGAYSTSGENPQQPAVAVAATATAAAAEPGPAPAPAARERGTQTGGRPRIWEQSTATNLRSNSPEPDKPSKPRPPHRAADERKR